MIFQYAQSSVPTVSDIMALHDNAQKLIATSADLHRKAAAATGLTALSYQTQAAAVDKLVAPAVAAEAAAITAAQSAGVSPAAIAPAVASTVTAAPTTTPTTASASGVSGQTLLLVAGAALAAWFGIKKLREKN
jgi:hypothetical protein